MRKQLDRRQKSAQETLGARTPIAFPAMHWVRQVWQDARYGARVLRRTPGFSMNVGWLILRQSLWWSILGIAMGGAGAHVFGQVLSAWLFGISASDPITLAVVMIVLGLKVVVASSIPILRTRRVEPTVALRYE